MQNPMYPTHTTRYQICKKCKEWNISCPKWDRTHDLSKINKYLRGNKSKHSNFGLAFWRFDPNTNRDQPLVVGNTYVKYNCWRFKGNTVAVSKLCKVQTHDLTLSVDFLTARINILFYWRLLLESQVTYGWSIIAVKRWKGYCGVTVQSVQS